MPDTGHFVLQHNRLLQSYGKGGNKRVPLDEQLTYNEELALRFLHKPVLVGRYTSVDLNASK